MFNLKKSLLLVIVLINSCSFVVATDDKSLNSSPVRNRLNEAKNYSDLVALKDQESAIRLAIEVDEFEAKAQMERTAMAMKNYIHMKRLSRDLSKPSIEESRLLVNILLSQNKSLAPIIESLDSKVKSLAVRVKSLDANDSRVLMYQTEEQRLEDFKSLFGYNEDMLKAISEYALCKNKASLEAFSKNKLYNLLITLRKNYLRFAGFPIYAKIICYLDRAVGYKFVPGNCECRDCTVILCAVKN